MRQSRPELRAEFRGAQIVGQAEFIAATEAALAIYVASTSFESGQLALRLIRQRAASSKRPAERNVDVDEEVWRRPVIEFAAHLAAADFRVFRRTERSTNGQFDEEAESALYMLGMLIGVAAEDDSIDRAWRMVTTDSLTYIRTRPSNDQPDSNSDCRDTNPRPSRRPRVLTWCRRVFGRRQAYWNDIAIVGNVPFLRKTIAALELLKQASHADEVLANLGIVIQHARQLDQAAVIHVASRRSRIYVAWDKAETLSTIHYASVLAHVACHSLLYRRGEEYSGPDSQRVCIDYALEVLRELGAPEELLEETEWSKLLPLEDYPPDDYFFQQFDWRDHRTCCADKSRSASFNDESAK